jgi:dUTP pyrophosphatase
MNSIWYELEIMVLDTDKTGLKEKAQFYKDIFNRPDDNAGFDVYSAGDIHIEQTPEFIPFGIVARLLRVQPMPGGTSNDWLKTDSHFWLMPRSSIYKTGLMMGNSTGVIDKSYRGELKAPVWSMTANSNVQRGDRLFQIVAPDMGWIRTVRIVDSMPGTERGAGGFGSTGR